MANHDQASVTTPRSGEGRPQGGPEHARGVRRIRAEQIVREQITKSRRPNEFLSSQSVAQHHVTESAVLASEIEQLPDLRGFLKFASQPEWKRTQLRTP
jgi:Type IV secretion-system coupling protein DNA-binding domain